ncbi:MAG: hypothetical protein ACFCVK_17380 [Acidimicrobiales bacterium]
MIVQSGDEGVPRLVLTMDQHTATGATMAEHFGGTDGFDRLEPHQLVVGLVGEHDRGWVEVDAGAPRHPGPCSNRRSPPWPAHGPVTLVSARRGR